MKRREGAGHFFPDSKSRIAKMLVVSLSQAIAYLGSKKRGFRSYAILVKLLCNLAFVEYYTECE